MATLNAFMGGVYFLRTLLVHAKGHPSSGSCWGPRNTEHASMKSYYPQLPIPFDTDWHHQFGDRLSVFPRNISFRAGGAGQDYWPDLATFTEDMETTQMMYFPAGPSQFSLCVIYRSMEQRWETVKFCDDLLLQRAIGETYEEVMEQTIAGGLCRGEA